MHANKLLKLHHELFYPAILGAIIYDFARKIGDGWTTGILLPLVLVYLFGSSHIFLLHFYR